VGFVFDDPTPGIQVGAIALTGEYIVIFHRALQQSEPDLEKIVAHEITPYHPWRPHRRGSGPAGGGMGLPL
jgi:hypothetical protein